MCSLKASEWVLALQLERLRFGKLGSDEFKVAKLVFDWIVTSLGFYWAFRGPAYCFFCLRASFVGFWRGGSTV